MTLTQNTDSKLIIASAYDLLDHTSQDRKIWSQFSNISQNVSLIDRSQKIEFPYQFTVYDKFKMQTDLSNFNLTYEETCDKRASELLAHSDKTGLPIYLMWSGGIDSTTVLVAFLRQRSHAKLKEQLVILMSLDSIDEYPDFYYTHIRGKFKIEPADHICYLFNGSGIIIGGEHNDQLFGSDIIGKVLRMFPLEKIKDTYKNKILYEFFKNKGMDDESATHWFDMLVWHAEQAPCEIKNNFDLLWWLNFNFKWQNVWFRLLLRVDDRCQHNICPEWLDRHYDHFFTSADFQKWSMLNPDKKIHSKWNTYKFTAKEYIYNYTKDAMYRDFKEKRGSLFRLFIHKNTPTTLTGDWQYIKTIDKTNFFNIDNNFLTYTQ